MREIYEFHGFRLDTRRRALQAPDGRDIPLRGRVFDTLCVLVRRAGHPVSKAELMQAVWPDAVVEENNLNQAISTLRRALGDNRHKPTFITTITGQGYQFVAAVNALPSAQTDVPDQAEATAAAGDGPAGAGVAQGPGLSQRASPRETAESPAAAKAPQTGAPRSALAAVLALAALLVALVLLRVPEGDEAPSERTAISLASARLATPFEGAHSSPALSPDGNMLAFVSDRSGTPQLWLKAFPDGQPVQVTDGDLPASAPSWSPTGNALLFERPTANLVPAVWMVDALGTQPPRLILEDARRPRFAPDGSSFVFERGGKGIHIASLDGGGSRALKDIPDTPGFAEPMPAINAAGDIAFVLADEGPVGNLWLYRAMDRRFIQLTQSDSGLPGVMAQSPAWLPGGRSIVYAAAPEDAMNFHLWLADAETGGTQRLSTGVGGYGEPVVSADGSVLAYAHARPSWRLLATDTDTGAERTILESRSPIALPQVSADGRSVTWFGDSVYTVPVSGGEAVRRTFGASGEATLPTWSRSSAALFYYEGRSLHRLDPATGVSERVLEDFHWSSRNWLTVHGTRLAYFQRADAARAGYTVVEDLLSGNRRQLQARVLPTEWSRDGSAFLGRRARDSALVTCEAPDFRCNPVLQDGEPVAGALPHWSFDGRRIFFRRLRHDRPGYADIWVVPREGGRAERVIEIGPFQRRDMSFGVARGDAIVWPRYNPKARSEIWTVRLREPG